MKSGRKSKGRKPRQRLRGLAKTPSGIQGLDQITRGGLPRGRPTLVCGGAGCGKSLFAMEFLVRGALDHGENGVFMSFEEPVLDLVQNASSLGFDLDTLVKRKRIALDHVHIEKSEIEESGEYDLEGLFIRLEHAIDSIGAKRVVLDTIESLFSGLSDTAVLRSEIRRLFHWLKDRGVTAVITGERGDGTLTRQGLEEYVSDCVILLDHRVVDQIATRRLRIVKYRGSTHGTNEYPFLIDEDGISVLPLTSLALEHTVTKKRVSTGIPDVDAMLEGKGFYRGSSILVSGTAGTGKSTLAATFLAAACERGERCLCFAFEESKDQMLRNMGAIGVDLGRWLKAGRLEILTTRPTYHGLEMHLASVHKAIKRFGPDVVVFDPVSNMIAAGTIGDVQSMLLRLVDFLKGRGITAMFTSLTHLETTTSEHSDIGISSLMDTWMLLRDIEIGGERNRGIFVLKSRGMAHSNQIREFLITKHGIRLLTPYLGPTGVLTGSSRLAEEARSAASEMERLDDFHRAEAALQRKQSLLRSQIAALEAELIAEQAAMTRSRQRELEHGTTSTTARSALSQSRGVLGEPAMNSHARPGGKRDQ